MKSRMQGTVVEYDTDLEMGFIKPDEEMRRQVVVRKEDVDKAGISTLTKGDRVEFTRAYDETYIPIAVDIVRLSS